MAESCANPEDDGRKLSDIFDDALDIYETVLRSDEASSCAKLQIDIKNCINLLEQSTRLINAAGVFSSNETLDEIPSQNIKYLLIPALLGSLVVKVQTANRIETLETAEIYFKDFLKRVQDYEISSFPNLENLEETDESEETKPKKLDLQQLALQRSEKIRKYNQQKEAEAELKRLKSLMMQDDDEICRNYYLAYIRNFVNISLDELKLIRQEKPLAKHLAETRARGTYSQERAEDKAQLRPFKPIIITRNELQKKVFGAGYPSLPTMTVDEFYRERVAEGIFPAHGSSHGKVLQEMTDPEVVKREEEKEEVQKEKDVETDNPNYLGKTRAMDDYKDTHKRGWGNRMNRS